MIVHPYYSEGYTPSNYDLALLKLEKPLPDDYVISELADGSEFISKYILVGYGVTAYNDRDTSAILRKVEKPKEGVTHQDAILTLSSAMCSGDSGGPVFSKGLFKVRIMGVNTAVNGPGDPCRGTNFAQYVPFHRQWILDRAAELEK